MRAKAGPKSKAKSKAKSRPRTRAPTRPGPAKREAEGGKNDPREERAQATKVLAPDE